MVDKRNIKNIYALSPMQEGMLMHSVYGDSPLAYFEQTRYRITGKLELDSFVATWQEIVKRHDILRTLFVYENVPKPIQIVLKDRPIPIDVVDLKGISFEQALQKIDEEELLDREHPFHLTKDCLMRMKVFCCENNTFEIIWSSHHILMDGWSLGIILNDFFAIYKKKVGVKSNELNTAVSYGEFIKFLKNYDVNASLLFWKDYLKGFHRQSRLACAFTQEEAGYTPAECQFKIDLDTTEKLNALAQSQQLTIGSILQSLWSLVVWSLNDLSDAKLDVVFGVTVAGRPSEIDRVGEIAGLFINTVPARFQGDLCDTMAQYVSSNHQASLQTKSHHFASLADIQNQSNLKQKLFDHIFVFENYPLEASEKTGEDIGLVIDHFKHFDFTNYDFTFQAAPAESLEFKFLYNKNKYADDTINYLRDSFLKVIHLYARNADLQIGEIFKKNPPTYDENRFQMQKGYDIETIDDRSIDYVMKPLYANQNNEITKTNLWGYRKANGLEVFSALDDVRVFLENLGLASSERQTKNVVINASFTAEPIKASIEWWLRHFGLDRVISFAPYNQIFQQCLDPHSDFSKSSGENIIFIRVLDWVRDVAPNAHEKVLKENSDLLLGSIRNRLNPKNVFVFFCPFDSSGLDLEIVNLAEKITAELIENLNRYLAVSAFDLKDDITMYGLQTIFDAKQDEIGHIPFSQEAFDCFGTIASRKLVSYFKPSFKVIVLDCDNTLWGGVVGEAGVEGVEITEGYKKFQSFLLEKYNSGFLLALSSKNNEEDVWAVFDKNPEMILKRQHFAGHRINWKNKSGNIKELAIELNLGLNSFIFIDDSLLECNDVMNSCPEVFTLVFPEKAKNIDSFLYHNWVFDQFVVTNEDLQRNEMVQSEAKRNEEKTGNSSIEDFLKNLDLKIDLYHLHENSPKESIERSAQLTMRTNQFNLSTKRFSEVDIISLIKNPSYDLFKIHVSDRFGTYGWVGLFILHKESKDLEADTFLLSCRVLGRNVEHSILNWVLKYAQENGLDRLKLDFVASQKNTPIKEFLDSVFSNVKEKSDGVIEYSRQSSDLLEQGNVAIRNVDDSVFDLVLPNKQPAFSSKPIIDAQVKNVNTEKSEIDFSFDLVAGLQHEFYYAPVFNCTSSKLGSLGFEETLQRNVKTKYVMASNEDEEIMAKLWGQVLNIHKIGILDNFFELGGHSLLATRLLSLIYNQFKKELSLKEFYAHPTISQLIPLLQSVSDEFIGIEKQGDLEYYPVSYSQKRLWALQNLDEGSFAYNTPSNYMITGNLDVGVFQQAIALLIVKHESLRTNFIVIDGKPFQKISKDNAHCFEYIENFSGDIDEYLKAESETPFDLETDSLFRVKIIRLQADQYVLHMNMHHIISDGWSMEVIEKDVMTFYEALLSKQNIIIDEGSLQFKDFASWHNQIIDNADSNKNLKQYWLEKMSGELPKLNLPYDRDRPVVQTHRGRILNRVLNKVLFEQITDFSLKLKCSKFVVLNSLVKLLLYKYSGQKDIIVGVPVSGRTKTEFQNMVGFFVNTIALRDTINSDESLESFVAKVNKMFTDGYDHQFYPFDLLVEDLGLERDFSRSPIFDIFMSYLKFESNEEVHASFTIKNHEVAVEISRFDLMFHFVEKNDEIILDLTYNIDLFDHRTIEKLYSHLEQFSTSLLNNSSRPIKQASVLEEPEKKTLYEYGNLMSYRSCAKEDETILNLFSKVCDQFSKRIALSEGTHHLTYDLLDKQTNLLAIYLEQNGVRKGDVVACVMPKSRYSVMAMLAIFKAGGVYLPIDSKLPLQRIQYYLEDSQAQTILMVNEVMQEVGRGLRCINMIEAFDELDVLSKTDNHNLPMVSPDDHAYLIYTSGSTGNPKGVLLKHAGFVNMCLQQIKAFHVSKDDFVLWFSSPSFDASMSEIFMCLFGGANLVIPRPSDIADTISFEELLINKKISIVTLPPVYLNQLNFDSLRNIKSLITAGESPILSDVEKLLRSCSYYNAYGPTECSVCATIKKVDTRDLDKKIISIGKPIDGLGVLILDEDLSLSPLGHKGQMALCGVGLADGYINKQDLTDDKFKFLDWLGDRVYLTGDLGHWGEQGELIFDGRMDSQVKFRGYRIELNEINIAIQKLGMVQDVCTMIAGTGESRELLSFLLCVEDIDTILMRNLLSDVLPAYMIPQRFVVLKQFPLNNNGKVDKEKLLGMSDRVHSEKLIHLPENDVQKSILDEVMKVLKVSAISIDDNIFELGTDSIRVIELVARLRKLGFQLKTQSVFKHPTVRQMANVVVQKKHDTPLDFTSYSGELLLSPIQKWYFETFKGYSQHFNHSEIYECKQDLKPDVLRQTVSSLADAHSILRARVEGDSMRILSDVGSVFKEIYVANDKEDLEAHIKREQEDIADFNGALWKICLFKGFGKDRLLFCFHHLIIDGVSWRLLIDDFFQIYSEIEKGISKKRSYLGFQEWTKIIHSYSQSSELLDEFAYWKQLENDEALSFRSEKQDVKLFNDDIGAVKISFDEKETENILKRVLTGLQCNINELLLSSLAWSLASVKSCKDTVIMMEGHGRDEHLAGNLNLSEIVGWFTNAFPFKLHFTSESFQAQIAKIKKTYEDLPKEGIGYSILRYITSEYLGGTKLTNIKPWVSFNFLGQYDGFGESPYLTEDFSLSDFSVGNKTPMLYSLSINGMIHNNKLVLYFSYHNQVHKSEFIAKIANQFQENLLSLFSSLPTK